MAKHFRDIEVTFNQEDINRINYSLLSEEDKKLFTQQFDEEGEQKKLQKLKREQEANERAQREKSQKGQTRERSTQEQEDFWKAHPEEHQKYQQRFQEERQREEQKKYTEEINAHKYDL